MHVQGGFAFSDVSGMVWEVRGMLLGVNCRVGVRCRDVFRRCLGLGWKVVGVFDRKLMI